MKIYIMTDMEGCAGILNHDDWVLPSGRYYDAGKRLLTAEVNAVIRGFRKGGATHIMVVDGHGTGGILSELLDPDIELLRTFSFPPYPFGLDKSFDAVAFVGQHAKAGTPFSHITHTGNFRVKDLTVNGLSIGEYGQISLCAMELQIPVILACGEAALTQEAVALTPGVFTVAGKEGLCDEPVLKNLSMEEYALCKLDARHYAPADVHRELEVQALAALQCLQYNPMHFRFLQLNSPYQMIRHLRSTQTEQEQIQKFGPSNDLISLFNLSTVS